MDNWWLCMLHLLLQQFVGSNSVNTLYRRLSTRCSSTDVVEVRRNACLLNGGPTEMIFVAILCIERSGGPAFTRYPLIFVSSVRLC